MKNTFSWTRPSLQGLLVAIILCTSLVASAKTDDPMLKHRYYFRYEEQTPEGITFSVWYLPEVQETNNGIYNEHMGGECIGTVNLVGLPVEYSPYFIKTMRLAFLNPGEAHYANYWEVVDVKTSILRFKRTWTFDHLYFQGTGTIRAFYKPRTEERRLWGMIVAVFFTIVMAFGENAEWWKGEPLKIKLKETIGDNLPMIGVIILGGFSFMILLVSLSEFGEWRNLGWNLLLLVISVFAGLLLSAFILCLIRAWELCPSLTELFSRISKRLKTHCKSIKQ